MPSLPPLSRIPGELVSLADYARRAPDHLPPAVHAWLHGGAGAGRTLAANRQAFARWQLLPRVLRDLSCGHTRLELFGDTLPYPLLVAPVAHQCLLHPDGERATLLGASAMGAAMVVSTQANHPLETLADEAHGPLWFQLYLQPRREDTERLLRRVERAGYRALVVTVDAPVSGGQRYAEQRLGFQLPAHLQAVNLTDQPPPPAHQARPGQPPLFGSHLVSQAPSWDTLGWLCRNTSLPVLVKGILHGEDARLAREQGAAGVIVSNHGGRVLDGMPAALEQLPQVVAALPPEVPVLMDGGIRSGTDLFIALALGARAVLVGRPCMDALATAGAAGVAHALHLLRTELETAMVLCGRATLADIGGDALLPATPPQGVP